MTQPNKGCCGTCGWLAKRVRPSAPGAQREHSGFYEVEPTDRERPRRFFNFVPGETNSWKQGELTCYRHAADLQAEIRSPRPNREVATDEDSESRAAAQGVIWMDRRCPRWSAYEPGISPREQLREVRARQLEDDRREFQLKLNAFEDRQQERQRRADRRLTWAAALLATIIGVAQLLASLLTMSKDALAYPYVNAAWRWLTGH